MPKDVEPFRTLSVNGELSGNPSTSEPTNILTKNPTSHVTEHMMREMNLIYRFPLSIEVRLATFPERINYKIPGVDWLQ